MAWVISSLIFMGAASASVAGRQQCGGIGYTGETNCVDEGFCKTWTSYDAQCVPGTSTSSSCSSNSMPTSVHATSSNTSQSSSTASSSSSSGPSQTSTPGKDIQYFISFGDSYSQTGFNYSSTKPYVNNPLGNPPLPGWTASGGLNWIGFMVTEFNTTAAVSYNFAYGGATVDADLVTPYTSTVKSFVDQVTDFSTQLASHPSYAPWTADNTIVAVWMGVNDIGNSFWLEDEDELLEKILTRYFEQLQIIYDAGARNFVLLTVPPIYKTPTMLEHDEWSQATEKAVIEQFNSVLETYLDSFAANNTDVVSAIVDTTKPFNVALDHPESYGSPNATCYNEDGLSCLWFNDYHPGVAINKLVAAAVAEAVEELRPDAPPMC